jgi:hypothetical protein
MRVRRGLDAPRTGLLALRLIALLPQASTKLDDSPFIALEQEDLLIAARLDRHVGGVLIFLLLIISVSLRLGHWTIDVSIDKEEATVKRLRKERALFHPLGLYLGRLDLEARCLVESRHSVERVGHCLGIGVWR